MTRQLKPWAYGPFEVLLHAETHYSTGEDLDRRIAMIGFDNAIEVAITTYLSLNPIQRGNRNYPRDDVASWQRNFHTKLTFFFSECASRGLTPAAQQDELVWFHDVRNEQYHGGGANVPQRRALDGVRAAALEVFSVLFDEADATSLLAEHLAELSPLPPPPRSEAHDRLIDNQHGMVEICGQPEYTSDLLYSLDPNRYREVALGLQSGPEPSMDEDAGA